MRRGTLVLFAGAVGVLIGGLVTGISFYSSVGKESPIKLQDFNVDSPSPVVEYELVAGTNTPETYSGDIDPIFHVESVHESTVLNSDFDQSVSLYLLLARADVGDLERYIGESFAISSRNQRVAALSIIFGRYAALNPHEALDRALKLEQLTMQERSNLVRSIFNEWTVADLGVAVAAIEDLPDPYKYAAASAVMWRSDFLSIDQRIQLAQQIGPNDRWINMTVSSIRSEVAKVDPRKAFYDHIRNRTQTQEHQAELMTISMHWLESEGAEILSEINASLDNANMRRPVLRSMVWNAIATNTATPNEVLNVVSEFSNRQDAKESIQSVFQAWASSDPKQSFEASFEFGNEFIDLDFRRSLLQMWAAKTANGLLEEATSLPREYQDIAVVTALGHISRSSPTEAIRLARGLDVRELQTQATDEIIRQWSSVNGKAAFEWLIDNESILGDANDASTFHRVFSAYLSQDFDSAQRFAAGYQGERKDRLIVEITRRFIHSDIERAIDYLPNIADEITRAELQFEIGHQLVEVDPIEALSYGKHVEESHKGSYYNGVLWQWAYNDFYGLHENIQRVPREFRTDAADALLRINEDKKNLSEREIRQLESMITVPEEVVIISSD